MDPPRAPFQIRHTTSKGRAAIATCALPQGTLATQFSTQPYAAVLTNRAQGQYCAHCFAKQTNLKTCAQCKTNKYCSTNCQAADWKPLHKHECPILATKTLDTLPEDARADLLLAARCLWRRHTAPSDADNDFDAMQKGTPTTSEQVMLNRLSEFGLEAKLFPPNATVDTVTSLLATFNINNFGILDNLHHVVAAGCYPKAALINHSCNPSGVLSFRAKKLQVRLLRPLQAGQELTHSFVDLCDTTQKRRRYLEQKYNFHCQCERCETPQLVRNMHPDEQLQKLQPLPPGQDKDTRDEALKQATTDLAIAKNCPHQPEKASALVNRALAARRNHCGEFSRARYEAEVAAFTLALENNKFKLACDNCQAMVNFLEIALGHVHLHPLLALQRITLAELLQQTGKDTLALQHKTKAIHALKITHGNDCDILKIIAS